MTNKFFVHKLLKFAAATLIALIIGTYFRLFPLFNYSPDDVHEKATLFVIAQIRSQVEETIDQKNPSLDPGEKAHLTKEALNEIIHKENRRIRDTIEEVAQKMGAGSTMSKNSPYLLASDSYYYFSLMENLIETGTMTDTVKGSKYLNKRMLAPEGHWEPLTWHPHVGFIVYKISRLFKSDTSAMFAAGATPLVVTALSLILFMALCFNMRLSALQSFVAAVFFLLIPYFIKRSTFAWFDNDPYIILFPLLLIEIVFLSFNRLDKRNFLLGSGLALALGFTIYSLFWQGWVFLFSILAASGIAVMFCNQFIFKDTAKNKNYLLSWAIFVSASFLFIGFAFGFNEFFILFKEGIAALQNFITPQLSPWPDLYISVGELFKSDIGQIVELSGGPVIIVVSVFGILYALIPGRLSQDKPQQLKAVVLLIYFCVALYLGLRAQRFIMLFIPPLALGFALGLKILYELLTISIIRLAPKIKNIPLIIGFCISVILLSSTLLPIINIKNTLPGLMSQIYNETWDQAFNHIRNNTPKDSIINTWWTPGHFIKAMARRRVTFDGATINVPQAYWMADVYLAQSEIEALGVLRMLNNSANQASEFLQQEGFVISESVALLKQITPIERFNANMILTARLKDPAKIQKLLALTHNPPPPSYILLFNELVEKNIQFGLFGKWNFKAIETINKNPAMLAKIPPRDSDEYVQFLWQLVGGSYRFSTPLSQIKRVDKIALFENGLSINLQTKDCQINSPLYGRGVPQSIFYLENGKFVEKKQGNPNLNYSLLLLKDDDRYQAILLDEPLAKSILIRLYYFDGAGLKYIKPFYKVTDLTKRTVIKIFSVDWEKFQESYGK